MGAHGSWLASFSWLEFLGFPKDFGADFQGSRKVNSDRLSLKIPKAHIEFDQPNQGAVRLELGNPCPDCFGMKKSFLAKPRCCYPTCNQVQHEVMEFAAWK